MGKASFGAINASDARCPRSLYAKTPNLLGRIGPPSAPALTEHDANEEEGLETA